MCVNCCKPFIYGQSDQTNEISPLATRSSWLVLASLLSLFLRLVFKDVHTNFFIVVPLCRF